MVEDYFKLSFPPKSCHLYIYIILDHYINLDQIANLQSAAGSAVGSAVGNAASSAAFMALKNRGIHLYNKGDKLPFGWVLLNVGDHYDAETSVFTCAKSGLYLFSVTLYSGGKYTNDFKSL